MNVTVVIPVWNGEYLLRKNIDALINAKKNSRNSIHEIIVVDDASDDGSVEFLKSYKDDIKVIKHTKNRGFATSVNRGFSYAKTPLVCLLNQDIIVTENFLDKVIRHFKDKKVFAVSLHEMGYGPFMGFFVKGFFGFSNLEEFDKPVETMWASGSSAVFRRKIWRKLNGLDEVLFHPFYWEDVDISYRAQKRGYEIIWESSAHVVHNHKSVINEEFFSTKNLIKIKERNYLLFTWKNITSTKLFREHIFELLKRVISKPTYLPIVLDALKKIKDVRRLRKRERKFSTVSDEAVYAKFVIR